MDNDSTMSSKLSKEIERHIEDLKDINHTKNNSGSHLEGLQKTHKALTWKVYNLSSKMFQLCTGTEQK